MIQAYVKDLREISDVIRRNRNQQDQLTRAAHQQEQLVQKVAEPEFVIERGVAGGNFLFVSLWKGIVDWKSALY